MENYYSLKNILKEGPIRCIFFCEFHHIAGPIISCQVPTNYISKELFDSVSVYIITKLELQRCTITVTLSDNKILGFPVRIDDKKYQRNAYYFNLCFACDETSSTVQYEPVIMKFSEYLRAMEVESNFLSSENLPVKLTPILTQVMNDLNQNGECTLTNGPTATHLKVVQVRTDPAPVADHQVPIFIRNLTTEQRRQQWDLTAHAIAPHIDGFNHVARIAALADVENNLVKACVQNLVYYGVVALVPLFQYGNVYCTTPKLKILGKDTELKAKCLQYVAKSQRQLPTLKDVFRLYAAMTRGTTIRDLCVRFNPSTLLIDERKLVQFGVLEGLIRRIHKYPVLLSSDDDVDYHRSPSTGNDTNQLLQRSLNGIASLDEICCATGGSTQQLEDQLERDHNVVLLWK